MGNETYRPRIADKLLANKPESMGAVLIEEAKLCGKTTTAEQAGGRHFFADLVESRKATLFCSDFWIRAYFEHYYGETRFSKAFLHIITEIMLFQLDSSRIPYEICSS